MTLADAECARAIALALKAKRRIDHANAVVEGGALEAFQDASDCLAELTEWASAYWEDVQARMREIEKNHDIYLEGTEWI